MPPSASSSALLCLACSASLPPRKGDDKTFYTQCCSRPICPKCISSNPRLRRYNPRLRCLAGVDAVSATRASHDIGYTANSRINVDASIRDEDIFVVEDSSDDEADPEGRSTSGHSTFVAENNASFSGSIGHSSDYHSDPSHVGNPLHRSLWTDGLRAELLNEDHTGSVVPVPKYFIRPDDSLLGIALKLGIDARILCRLNNLPMSALRTTPHLLHTRAFLVLPPSTSIPELSPAERALDVERRARLVRERAETRFQSMTKETDRHVAKAYVALADLPDGDGGDFKEYQEEKGLRKRRPRPNDNGDTECSLEGLAMDQYYNDEEWESRERGEGRKPAPLSFPYALAAESNQYTGSNGEKSRWKCNS